MLHRVSVCKLVVISIAHGLTYY
ncbi:hypothetical protein BRAO285_1120003 [Bradyrhizobium sp. ORS 285]|nr:hypothetical protein BRAO285_1120003 [Bradyrhizobium sp. ORS 285]